MQEPTTENVVLPQVEAASCQLEEAPSVDKQILNSHQQPTSEQEDEENQNDVFPPPTEEIVLTEMESISSKTKDQKTKKDRKLKMRCMVMVERLDPYLEKAVREGSTSIQRKVPVNGKKRVLQIADSDDSDDGKSTLLTFGEDDGKIGNNCNDRQKNSVDPTPGKGKALKKVLRLDEGRNSQERKQRKKSLHEPSDDLSSDFDAPSTSITKTNSNNFVIEKFNAEDNNVIVLSSDDETFSQKIHFKIEPEDIHSDNEKSPSTSEEGSPKPVSSSSDADDGPFFPVLSQNFLNEIEEEQTNENTSVPSVSGKSTGINDNRLQDIVSSVQSKPKPKQVIHIDPKDLPLHQSGRRFTLATGGESTRKEAEDAEESVGKSKGKATSVPQRTLIPIPMRPQKKKKPAKSSSVRDEICKNQDLQSYVVSVKEANSRPQGRTANTVKDCAPVLPPPTKNVSKPLQVPNFPKIPKSAPPPAKVRVDNL